MLDISTLPRWNLTDLYTSPRSESLQTDIKKLRAMAAQFRSDYQGNIGQLSAELLTQAIQTYEAYSDLSGKIASYAYLTFSENMEDSQKSSFYQSIMEAVSDADSDTVFFTLELNNIADDTLDALIKSSPSLKMYQPWLREIRLFRPHQLSEELETMLHEKSITGKQAWSRLFDEKLAEVRFDYDGETLAIGDILDKLSDHGEDTRKKAAHSLGKGLASEAKFFAYITNTLAKDKAIEDKKRRFSAPISSRNLSNSIEDEVVEALLSTVQKNYPALSHRYYALKAKWLNVDKLDYWNRNAPLPETDKRLIPWGEAREIVLSAYHDFSPTLAEMGQEFFDKNWIDAPSLPGKDSGAFSHPTVPSSHPYILMNYQGKLNDVMTLAHELGHGVHQLLAREQGALMCDTPLTLAETASVFGEQLTFQAILKQQNNNKDRKNIIAKKVEDMLNTVVRQIAFCEFERRVHNDRKQGELSVEQLAGHWMNVQRESLGPALQFDDLYQHYWAYIPHFIHTPFYVYSYAFGDCLVNALYAQYQSGGVTGFEEKYLTMLKAGGTLHHTELLAPFHLDASQSNFWQKGLDIISHYIDELEEL